MKNIYWNSGFYIFQRKIEMQTSWIPNELQRCNEMPAKDNRTYQNCTLDLPDYTEARARARVPRTLVW